MKPPIKTVKNQLQMAKRLRIQYSKGYLKKRKENRISDAARNIYND
jgi:hypothetical protein